MPSPTVVYEDNHLLIIEKPSGFLVQGDNTGDSTLTDWGKAYIKKKYQKPGAVFLHPCHRLDRPVSGLVIFARTSKALERMNKLFREDDITKKYLAVVLGRPDKPKDQLENWLIKDSKKNISKVTGMDSKEAKHAVLNYELLATSNQYSLVLVRPKTGRPHQIRVQLKSIKCSIKGDLKYGAEKPNSDKSISLHAYQVAFEHPVKKETLVVTSKPSWKEFSTTIDELD